MQTPASTLGDGNAAATFIAQCVADWAVGRGAMVEIEAKAHLQLRISFRSDSESVSKAQAGQLSWHVRIYDASLGVFFLDASKCSGDALQSYTEFARLMKALHSQQLVVPPPPFMFDAPSV